VKKISSRQPLPKREVSKNEHQSKVKTVDDKDDAKARNESGSRPSANTDLKKEYPQSDFVK